MNPDITLPKDKFMRVYIAQMTQTGTDAPTAEIQQNTLGYTITWTRNGAGNYEGELGETILDKQIWCNISGNSWDKAYTIRRSSSTKVQIFTGNVVTATLADLLLNQTPIEIRIYNIS